MHQPCEYQTDEPCHQKINCGGDQQREERIERAAADEVGSACHVHHGDVTHYACAFQQTDDLALIDRLNRFDDLRQDDAEEGLPRRVPQCQTGFSLPAVDALNGRTQHLADIGGGIHSESDDCHGYAGGAKRRHEHIVHQHQQHQYRRSAHEVNIDFRRLSEPRLAAHACPADDSAEQRTQHCRAERNQQRHLQTVQNHPVALLRYQVVGETVCYAGDDGVHKNALLYLKEADETGHDKDLADVGTDGTDNHFRAVHSRFLPDGEEDTQTGRRYVFQFGAIKDDLFAFCLQERLDCLRSRNSSRRVQTAVKERNQLVSIVLNSSSHSIYKLRII